ncbi:MAG: integral rane protein-like protein [Frankiales bacterium]|nr:integral rane protein-like protein [Frankiales bacterium]
MDTTTLPAPLVEATAAPRRSWRERLGPDWTTALTYCLVVYLCVRVALFVLGLLAVALIPMQSPVGVSGWPAQPQTGGWHNAITAWERADSLWFLRIASDGYRTDDSSAAFFPLFPMLVRGVGLATGGRYLLGGFLVSNLALISGLVVMFKLTAEELGERMARRAVLYLCLFPTAFFLFSPFSEPLFLALAVGAIYAARHSRWLTAGMLGAGAAATRSVGVLLCAVLAVEAVHQFWTRRQLGLRLVGALACCAVPALGTLAYLGYWQQYGSGWSEPFHAQGGWDRHLSAPWQTLARGFSTGTDNIGAYPGGYWTIDLLLVVLALVLGVWVAIRTRPVYGVYTGLSLLFPLLFMFDGRPLMSVPRFLLPVFPLFWAMARFAERWKAHDLVVGLSAAGLSVVGACAVAWLPIF